MAVNEQLINSRYRLQDMLGEGGMGAVYRAADRLTGQTIALKRVTVSGDQLQFASQSTDQDFRLSLAQEFRTLAGLRHPHIVSVLDYGFDVQRQPYFTMQLIEGAQTLTEYAATLDTAGKVRVLSEMLQALAYLHRRGIVHRDLKPANVLVTADGMVKVMDFGLALQQSDSITNLYTGAVGTLAYMAPELFADELAAVQSDLYAVGVMMYEVLVGKYPFNLKNLALLVNSVLNEKPDTTMLDLDLAVVLDRLLVKVPTERYASADDVIETLCTATGQPLPVENAALRESYLQAAKFVGRDTELGQLITALDGILKGKGSTYLIGGESGVGKSRLLDELSIRALVEGALVLRGQGVEGGGLPYQLWRNPLRRLALSTQLSDLEAGVLKTLVPDISELLGRDIPDAPDLTGSPGQQRLVLTIADVFRRQTIPLALLLEDLQWTGESLLPLKRLNDLAGDLPLLIIGTYRNDETPDLPHDLPGMQPVRLTRLSNDEIVELSTSMLGEAGKQTDLIELLKRETEGNTFFMVETVRALAEDAGALQGIGRMNLPRSVLTGGVQQIIRRRLDRIPQVMNRLLKLAAIAGRQPDFKVLAAIETVKLADFITVCAGASVLEIVENQWRFTHDKLRETVLADLDADERPALHRQIAEAIEQVYPGDEVYADVLMEHWYMANDSGKTVHYTLLTCNRMVEYTGDYLTARNLLKRGLQIAERLPATLSNYYRARFLRLAGNAYAFQGNYAQAALNYQDCLQVAQDDSSTIIQALTGLCGVEIRRGNFPVALEYAHRGLKLALEIDDDHGIARCLYFLGEVSKDLGDYAGAKSYYEQSMPIYQKIGHQLGVATLLHSLGAIAVDVGDHAEAKSCYEQCSIIYRAMGNQRGDAANLNNLGLLAMDLGDYAGAKAYYEQSMAIHQAIGDRTGIGICLGNLATVVELEGDYEGARDYLKQALEFSRELGTHTTTAINLNNLGFVHLGLHENIEARRSLHEGLMIANEARFLPLIMELIVGFIELRLQTGDINTQLNWLGLVVVHPATQKQTIIHRVDPLKARLEAEMGSEALAEAFEAGKSLDLETVVAEILAEYGENPS